MFSIVMIFIASLGNRPQGSRLLYFMSFTLFAVIMGIMLYIVSMTLTLRMHKGLPPAGLMIYLIVGRFFDLFDRPSGDQIYGTNGREWERVDGFE